MSKRTPGPWHIDGNGIYSDNPLYDGEDPKLSQVPQNLHVATVHHSDANARLIAAAPELAEALRGVVDASDHGTEALFNAVQDAREALAKIEGRDAE